MFLQAAKLSIRSILPNNLNRWLVIFLFPSIMASCNSSDSFYTNSRTVSHDGFLSDNSILRGNGLNCLLDSPTGYRNSPPTLATYYLIAKGVLDDRILMENYRKYAMPILRGDSYAYFDSIKQNTIFSRENLFNAIAILEAQDQVCLTKVLTDLFNAQRTYLDNQNLRLLTFKGEVAEGREAYVYLERTIANIQDAQRASLEWHLGLFQDFNAAYETLSRGSQEADMPRSDTFPRNKISSANTIDLEDNFYVDSPSIFLGRIDKAHYEDRILGDDISPALEAYIKKRRGAAVLSIKSSPLQNDGKVLEPSLDRSDFRSHQEFCRMNIRQGEICSEVLL